MPYQLDDSRICLECPHGRCIEYLGDKVFKDRETKYRLKQNIISACVFDRWLPGSWAEENDRNAADSQIPWEDLLSKIVENGLKAGAFLVGNGRITASENGFFLTKQQIGKVRGDVFQMLVGAILWNSCVLRNKIKQDNSNSLFVAITLGDDYDLKSLLTEDDSNTLKLLQDFLQKNNTSLAFSTPDFVVIDITASDQLTRNYFEKELTNFSKENQDVMVGARSFLKGKVRAADIIAAIGLKTSIRSDRMYQLLYEANSWKFLWRSAFKTNSSRYYAVFTGHYGADPQKLESVNFCSFSETNVNRAIDGVICTLTPADLMASFESILVPIKHNPSSNI
jgi:hypothetical protein